LELSHWASARIESPLGAIALLGEGLAASFAAAFDPIVSDDDFAQVVRRICDAVAEHALACRKVLQNRGRKAESDAQSACH